MLCPKLSWTLQGFTEPFVAAISDDSDFFSDMKLKEVSVTLATKLGSSMKTLQDDDRANANRMCRQLNGTTVTLECSKGVWAKTRGKGQRVRVRH